MDKFTDFSEDEVKALGEALDIIVARLRGRGFVIFDAGEGTWADHRDQVKAAGVARGTAVAVIGKDPLGRLAGRAGAVELNCFVAGEYVDSLRSMTAAEALGVAKEQWEFVSWIHYRDDVRLFVNDAARHRFLADYYAQEAALKLQESLDAFAVSAQHGNRHAGDGGVYLDLLVEQMTATFEAWAKKVKS